MTTINTIQVPAAPPSNRVPAGLPDCQGRHGAREGSRRTDVDRADPGVSLDDVIDACLGRNGWFPRPEHGPLAISKMTEALSKIRVEMSNAPRLIGACNLACEIERLLAEATRTHKEVVPLTCDDMPPVVKGGLLDMKA